MEKKKGIPQKTNYQSVSVAGYSVATTKMGVRLPRDPFIPVQTPSSSSLTLPVPSLHPKDTHHYGANHRAFDHPPEGRAVIHIPATESTQADTRGQVEARPRHLLRRTQLEGQLSGGLQKQTSLLPPHPRTCNSVSGYLQDNLGLWHKHLSWSSNFTFGDAFKEILVPVQNGTSNSLKHCKDLKTSFIQALILPGEPLLGTCKTPGRNPVSPSYLGFLHPTLNIALTKGSQLSEELGSETFYISLAGLPTEPWGSSVWCWKVFVGGSSQAVRRGLAFRGALTLCHPGRASE